MKVSMSSFRTTQRVIRWVRVDENEWRCGNVRLIRTDDSSWYVKIKHKGRWWWAYSSQRPWGYGHASSAKRGVSRWKRIHLYDKGPQSETRIRQLKGKRA